MKIRRWWLVGGGICAVLLIGSGATYFALHPNGRCGFPSAIRENSSGLHLYCPDSTKLPPGFTSDISNASVSDGVVLYALKDGGSSLAISLQKKPDKNQLDNFVPNLIPLHFDVDTPIGKAQTGVSNGHSLTTLPTDSDTWIIITVPENYNPDRLTAILKTFQAD